ncbi:MAG: TIGR04084 family radical SAM/SPASM domain-containing protein [Nanoarchaeota archaeon]
MHYYMALTSRCNLQCKYCHGKCVDDFLSFDEAKNYDFNLPRDTTIDIQKLIEFAKKDPDFILTFYGGEPLIKLDLIKEVIDKVPAKEFMMQTNAQTLDQLPIEYANKISTFLTSIDGTCEHTNERRGKQVYEKVIANVRSLREQGYIGHIIARMTVDETCDIFESVTHLAQIKEFDGVHWQIDAQFWKGDLEQREFKTWTRKYNQGISKLINWWLEQIKKTNKVPLIYPFVAVMDNILTGKSVEGMRCGAGHSVLGLQTDGNVTACPITAGFKPLYMGDLNSAPEEIINARINPTNQCETCEILNLCGGRCLYANKTQLWGKIGFSMVCDTIFHLINELKRIAPELKGMGFENLNYRKYNGVEVIP